MALEHSSKSNRNNLAHVSNTLHGTQSHKLEFMARVGGNKLLCNGGITQSTSITILKAPQTVSVVFVQESNDYFEILKIKNIGTGPNPLVFFIFNFLDRSHSLLGH